jgi:histone acetyltransferase
MIEFCFFKDLTTLKTKILSNKFKTICDFIRDVNKIFNNCRQFNAIDSTFSQCANVVDNYFRHLLENLMVKEQN